MANIKSQKKRIITSAKAKANNKSRRTRVKNVTKEYLALIDAKDVQGAETKLPELVSVLMKSQVSHKNAVSRKVSQMTRLLEELKKEVA